MRSCMIPRLEVKMALSAAKIRGKDCILKKHMIRLAGIFFFDCLQQRGFCEQWCSWITEVVTSGTLSVKANNLTGPYFKSGRGVRQR